VRGNGRKLMPCKYFTLVFFMFVLKLQLLNKNMKKYGFENSLVKMVIKIPVFEAFEKVFG
jgi:hypothetical protein